MERLGISGTEKIITTTSDCGADQWCSPTQRSCSHSQLQGEWKSKRSFLVSPKPLLQRFNSRFSNHTCLQLKTSHSNSMLYITNQLCYFSSLAQILYQWKVEMYLLIYIDELCKISKQSYLFQDWHILKNYCFELHFYSAALSLEPVVCTVLSLVELGFFKAGAVGSDSPCFKKG